MATLNELSYNIFEAIRPNIVDDDDIDIRQIKSDIHNVRAKLIRQQLSKGRDVSNSIIQDLGCVEVEHVDAAECCDLQLDCNVIRMVNTLPSIMENYEGALITRVGPVNRMDVGFNFVSYQQAVFSGNGKFNSHLIYAFLLNNRIYLKSKSDLVKYIEFINVRGVFSNPEEAKAFNSCSTGEPCFSDDHQYPVESWMIDMILTEVTNKYITQIKLPEDTSNNSNNLTVNDE